MKIEVISPITAPKGEDYRTQYRSRDCAGVPAEFHFSYIPEGPASILNDYDDIHAASHVVRMAVAAEREGYDAVVINCSADTALRACREAVSIPVIGPTESSMLYAPQFVDTFAVLTFARRINSRFTRIAHGLGLSHHLACVRSVEISFEQVGNGEAFVVEALAEAIADIHAAHHCDGFILGCTDFEDVAPQLQQKLAAMGERVTVFKPFEISVFQAYSAVTMGLRTGKDSYPAPDQYYG